MDFKVGDCVEIVWNDKARICYIYTFSDDYVLLYIRDECMLIELLKTQFETAKKVPDAELNVDEIIETCGTALRNYREKVQEIFGDYMTINEYGCTHGESNTYKAEIDKKVEPFNKLLRLYAYQITKNQISEVELAYNVHRLTIKCEKECANYESNLRKQLELECGF